MNTVKALRNALACLVILPRFLVAAFMLWCLDFLCVRRRVLIRLRDEEEDEDLPLCISDSSRMFSWESLKAVFHGHKLDWMKSARLGRDAPNSAVVPLTDPTRRRVLDFACAQRPLLGSCSSTRTSPTRCIEEAHPSDGWISSDAPYQIRKHRGLEERLSAARLMAREAPGVAIVADSMENSCNSAYGAYFDRLYIVQDVSGALTDFKWNVRKSEKRCWFLELHMQHFSIFRP
uniref:Iodothyronine deiodinase n=1 Tax=Sinocyclocheilus rhinocerous TaxID=307959 RepID=A0A673N4A0_9TELE